MSAVVAGFIALVLIIGAFNLIAELVGGLFEKKEPHKPLRSTKDNARNQRLIESDNSIDDYDDTFDYKFEGLPQSIKYHYSVSALQSGRRNRSAYYYYKPSAKTIVSSELIEWKPRVSGYAERVSSEALVINHEDLDQLKAASNQPLLTRLDRDLADCRSAVGAYPALPPRPLGGISPPREPDLVSAETLLPENLLSALTAREIAYLKGFLRTVNAKRTEEFEDADRKYKAALAQTDRLMEKAVAQWELASNAWDEACKADAAELISLRDRISSEMTVEDIATLALSSAEYPIWFPNEFKVSFDEETRILIIELRLPNLETIEWQKQVFLKTSSPMKPLSVTERKKVNAGFYPLSTLSIAILLSKHFSDEEVSLIAVNGWVDFRSKSTGLQKRAFCSALAASAARLREIDLEHADPLTAFHTLKGATSPAIELAPVAPTLRLDIDDKRFVEGREILQGMAQDENLASMDWEDFEHLCRELFEKVFAAEGATVSVTQASRDQGVDAIIVDPDPIRGGKMVIQAKRYVNTVDVAAVRDLWGVVSHEGAMKGLLVTTSQFGPDSYAFAQGKPLTLINGSELLHLLEKNGYSFRINLEEARQLQRDSGAPPFRKRR